MPSVLDPSAIGSPDRSAFRAPEIEGPGRSAALRHCFGSECTACTFTYVRTLHKRPSRVRHLKTLLSPT
ncbi:hypothetical protein J6590_009125 [Homalodisca vitripennis]|nr:hypothetical protein J6590_009125 [Homalodisca vitripennis]